MISVKDDDDDDSSDDDNDDESDGNLYKSSSKKAKHISGDDLGLSIEDQPADKFGWADVIMEQKKEETDEEDSENEDGSDGEADDSQNNNDESSGSEGDSDNFPSMNDWEESEEEPIADDRGNVKNKGGDIEDDGLTKPTEKVAVPKNESLPFVIEAPRNLEELCMLLDHRSEAEIVEAINRIRACNSIRLKAENRKKMQVIFIY